MPDFGLNVWDLLLRGHLLVGLVAHKVIWEVLRRRNVPGSGQNESLNTVRIRLIKRVKVVILLGLMAQVFVPVVFPLLPESGPIRWIGAFAFAAGWLTAVAGRVQLGSNWSNIETPDVLTEQRVISHGVYRYIRHPIYVGDLLLLFGLEIALNSWLVIGPLLLAPVVLAKATREENMLRKRLPGYREYCRNSKRFVPYVV